jgi:hypothetical protein
MAHYVVRFSERLDYSVVVEADSEDSAFEKAYGISTFSDVDDSKLDMNSIEIEDYEIVEEE